MREAGQGKGRTSRDRGTRLLIVATLGAAIIAALGNWLSLVACVVLPLPAIIWRIHVEEAELNRVLGQTYRTYRFDRARLVPRVW